MATDVKVPSLGESISSGILATWHVEDGAYVEKDQLLFELETDKITSEGNAEASGVISLKAEAGDEVGIGQVIATIDEDAGKPEGGDEAPESPDAKGSGDRGESKDSGEEGREGQGADSGEKKQNRQASPSVSPAVRKLAEESGLDPADVEGTGKGGRVTKGDMLAALESRAGEDGEEKDGKRGGGAPAREIEAPARKPSDASRESRRRMSPLRRSIAQRLVAVQNEAAILTTFNEVDMSGVMDLRKRHQEAFTERHGVKLGFMSFFIKAAVQALRMVPAVNARIEDDEIVENHFFDIGVAVSTEKGLLVPVLRDCEAKSFAAIEKELGAFAAKARDGKIQIDDLRGGVFSITNGGVFGSLLSTPIINPPQSAILGMHSIQERPVAVDGQVVIRPMMYLALSYDHRLVDGKEAVTFLVAVKHAIEDPARLLFEI